MAKKELTRADKMALYEQLVNNHPNAELKGATIPYTSVNGHMYSYLAKDESLGLRLPAKEREQFLKKYKTKLMEQYGIIQNEYVVVPDTLLKKTKS